MAEPAVEAVLAHALRAGPRCGEAIVVIVDGPAGSGKTTAANSLRQAATEHGISCLVIQMDDLYEGWSGLRQGGEMVTAVLRAVSMGEPAAYRRYDWHEERYAETVSVPPVNLLVVEGVGSARPEHLDLVSTLVWVEEPDQQERLRRGLARDGAQVEEHWRRWMLDEAELFAEIGTRERADLGIDGVGSLLEEPTP